jgi:hypothetical protein
MESKHGRGSGIIIKNNIMTITRSCFGNTGKGGTDKLSAFRSRTLSGGRKQFIIIILLLSVAVLGCARSEMVNQCLTGHTYGFFGGLWHGFIAPFDFIAMLFNNEITMYAQNNNGGLYALGFLIGSGGWGFLGGKGVKKVRHGRVGFQSQRFDKAEIVE